MSDSVDPANERFLEPSQTSVVQASGYTEAESTCNLRARRSRAAYPRERGKYLTSMKRNWSFEGSSTLEVRIGFDSSTARVVFF